MAAEFETYVSDGQVGLMDEPCLVLINCPGDVNLFFAFVDCVWFGLVYVPYNYFILSIVKIKIKILNYF